MRVGGHLRGRWDRTRRNASGVSAERVTVSATYFALRPLREDRAERVAGSTVAGRLHHVGRVNGAPQGGAVLRGGVDMVERERRDRLPRATVGAP